ncbi:MAG: PA2169 family four-helix-bundle protein [Xanthomonadales bacterium]|nr:PA2169 family four-helix-bundle protein [Xanthomonadales bacterium]
MSDSNTSNLADIVQVARDSAEFYDHARKEVTNPIIQNLFARMAASKRRLIEALSTRILLEGEQPPESGTWLGGLRQFYADAKAMVASNDEAVYVSQLEETEDRVMEQLEKALEDIQDPAVRTSVLTVMPDARASHDEMRRLKQQLAA